MQSLPISVLEGNELANITLEYRRECGPTHVLQSLTSPQAGEVIAGSAAPFSQRNDPPDTWKPLPALQFAHLLRLQDDRSEILRARSEWRSKAKNNLHDLA